ncbi:unnamed protein product [Choristocarpus tenellus]
MVDFGFKKKKWSQSIQKPRLNYSLQRYPNVCATSTPLYFDLYLLSYWYGVNCVHPTSTSFWPPIPTRAFTFCRMPVILDREASLIWMEEDSKAALTLLSKFQAYDRPDLVWHPVTRQMNNLSFEDPCCSEEVKLKTPAPITNFFLPKQTKQLQQRGGVPGFRSTCSLPGHMRRGGEPLPKAAQSQTPVPDLSSGVSLIVSTSYAASGEMSSAASSPVLEKDMQWLENTEEVLKGTGNDSSCPSSPTKGGLSTCVVSGSLCRVVNDESHEKSHQAPAAAKEDSGNSGWEYALCLSVNKVSDMSGTDSPGSTVQDPIGRTSSSSLRGKRIKPDSSVSTNPYTKRHAQVRGKGGLGIKHKTGVNGTTGGTKKQAKLTGFFSPKN